MDPYQSPDDRDRDNPYAPPQSSFVPDTLPGLATGMPFSVGDVFNWSLAIFKERMWTCLKIYWGAFAINSALSIVMRLMLESLQTVIRDRTAFALLYILTVFTAVVIQVWIVWVGQTIAIIKICRREPVAFEDLFTGGRYVLTIILASIVFYVVLVVPIGVAVAVSTVGFLAMGNWSPGGIIVFLVVSVLAGLFFIYVSSRMAMFYYLIIDRGAGVFDSLQGSWNLCRDQVGTIVLIFCLQFVVLLAGLLALVVGLIWAIPLESLFVPVFYLALTGTMTRQPEKPEFVWEDDV